MVLLLGDPPGFLISQVAGAPERGGLGRDFPHPSPLSPIYLISHEGRGTLDYPGWVESPRVRASVTSTRGWTVIWETWFPFLAQLLASCMSITQQLSLLGSGSSFTT